MNVKQPIKSDKKRRAGCISDKIVEDVVPKKDIPWTKMRGSCFISPQELDELADEYIMWAQTTTCVKYSSFGVYKGIWPTQFAQWRAKSEKLDNAHELVKAIFAERRERRALDGDWHSGVVMATMPLYDVEYAAWRREVLASKDDSNSKLTIQIENMPTTDIVAHKRSDEESID